MAGTTIDENNLVYKTLQEAIVTQGFRVSLEEVLEKGAGKEKKEAIASILNKVTVEKEPTIIDIIYANFIILLDQRYQTAPIHAQQNAIEFFQSLQQQNIHIVLNTGYNRHTAEQLLQRLGWQVGKEIDAVITADDVVHGRPHPDMIQLAMKQFDIKKGTSVVKVGDSIIDIVEGQQAGCKLNIGITTGAHSYTQLKSANPTHIVDNLLAILPLLDQKVDVTNRH